jgi:hypothetical protein
MIFEFLVLKYLNNVREDSTGIYDEKIKWRNYRSGERIGLLDRAYIYATNKRLEKQRQEKAVVKSKSGKRKRGM